MATFKAIAGVCETVVRLLQAEYRPEDFNNELEFRVYLAKDFAQPMAAGVSLFLYRVYQNGVHRSPRGRIGPDGERRRTQLPLDLHFLLTAWGKDASLQHAITGWMMRALEDTPILPAALLNAAAPEVFRPDETVEVSLAELANEDLLRLWDTLIRHVYQLSVPYVARNVWIESGRPLSQAPPLQERTFDARVLRLPDGASGGPAGER